MLETLSRLRREPHDEAVRQAKIDRHDIAREQLAPAGHLREGIPGILQAVLGKLDIDAAIEAKVPATFSDANGGEDSPSKIRGPIHHGEQLGSGIRRAMSHDKKKTGVVGRPGATDHFAARVDDKELAFVLPDGKRAPLHEFHDDRVGHPSPDGDVANPGKRGNPVSRRDEIDGEHGLPDLDPESLDQRLAVGLLAAGHQDMADLEPRILEVSTAACSRSCQASLG